MKFRFLIPLLVAVALGVVAAKVGQEMLKRREAPSGTQSPQAKVITVKRDFQPGHKLESGDLTLTSLPVESAPEGALSNYSEAVGRVLAIPVARNQSLVGSSLAPEGSGIGLQALLPDGMRAVTIQVDEFSGMTGLIVPGCRVDVLATLVDEKTRESVARTIVENVQVSAVGINLAPKQKEPSENDKPAKAVTLVVTPREAEALELAAARGQPRLVLRGGRDNSPSMTPGITVAELIGVEPARRAMLFDDVVSSVKMMLAGSPTTRPAAVEPAPNMGVRRSVQVIRGHEETVKTFEFYAPTEAVHSPVEIISAEQASAATPR